jgi:hypothetical protein
VPNLTGVVSDAVGKTIRMEIPRKITDAQVVEIRQRFKAGELAPALAIEFGIARSSVHNIVAGRDRVRAGGPITRPKARPSSVEAAATPPSPAPEVARPWRGGRVVVEVDDRDVKAKVKEIRHNGTFVLVLPTGEEVTFTRHGVGDDATTSWVPDSDLARILGHVGLTLADGQPT